MMGYKLLEELGAVTDKRQLTSVGRQLALSGGSPFGTGAAGRT